MESTRHLGSKIKPAGLIAVFIVGAAIFRMPVSGGMIRLSMALFFECAVALCLAVAVWSVNRWIALFLLLSTFSMLYPLPGIYSKASYLAVIFGVLFFYLIATLLKPGDVNTLLNALCIICIVHALFQVVQLLNITTILRPSAQGLMANLNEVSALMAFCFPAFLRKKWWILLPLPIFGLIAAKSFGGMLALSVGLLFYTVFNGRRCVGERFSRSWLLLLILAGLYIYFELIDKPGISVRWLVWHDGVKLSQYHPIFGTGIGHWKLVFERISYKGGTWFATAHNEYLQGYFEMGVFFIVIVFGYLISVFRLIQKFPIPVLAIVIVAVNCVYNFPMHIAPTAMIALVWMAILEIQLNGRRNHRSTS